jgi:hypothetical protein
LLGESTIRKWKIPTSQDLQLRFGSSRQDVRVASVSQASALRVSHSLASRMGLMSGKQLCLQYKPSTRTIVIGPLIGVMVSRVYSGAPDRPFGTITTFCREMTDACAAHGAFVYFFTPDDVTTLGDTLKGHVYAGRWVRGTFPVPNVIYNRLTSRKLENRPTVQQFMSHAKSRFNAAVFNDMYLPESHLLKSAAMLKAMCSRYSTVFLKPVTGSLGKGIIRIRKQGDGSYACHHTNMSGASKMTYAGISQLTAALSAKIRQQTFQIQQGLNLISTGGRPIDFRALVQRDSKGQWGVTSIVARIAGVNHFVSNLARGGTLSQVPQAIARSNAANKAGAHARLKRAALQIAKGIESQIDGHFAELGVDLALDTGGRVWLLEVNSKPSKDDNTSIPSERSKVRPSVNQMVQYARHLAKF